MNKHEYVLNALLILGLLTVILTPWIIKARERRRVHDTLSKLIDKGVVPPPELLKALTDVTPATTPRRSERQRDLRLGIIWLSVAAGIAGLALAIVIGHDPRYFHVPIKEPLAALGIAAFPAAVGLGYLILWLVGRNRQTD